MSVKPSFFDVTIGPEHPPGSLATIVTPDGDRIEVRLPNINVKAGDVVQFFLDGGGLGSRVQRNRRSSTASADGRSSAGGRSSLGGRSSEETSVTDELLTWCQEETKGVPNVFIANFSSSFGDGLAILALMRHAFPREVPPSRFAGPGTDAAANWDLAFCLAARLDCPQLLDSEDIASCRGQPDARSIVTYLLHLRRKLKAYLGGETAAPASSPATSVPKAAPAEPAVAAEPKFRPGMAGRKPPSLDETITPSLSRLPLNAAMRESDKAVQASPAPAVAAAAVTKAAPAPAAALAKAPPPAATPAVPTLAVATAATPGRRWGEQPKPHESLGMRMARTSREQLEAQQAEEEEQAQQHRAVSFPARSPRGPPPRPQTAQPAPSQQPVPTPAAVPAPSRPATAGPGSSKPPPPPNQRRPFDWPGGAPTPAVTPASAAAPRVPPPAAPRAAFVPPPAGVPVAGGAGVQRTHSLQPKKTAAFGTNSSRRPPPRKPFDWPADAPWPPVVGVSN